MRIMFLFFGKASVAKKYIVVYNLLMVYSDKHTNVLHGGCKNSLDK
jgi:hypothetical protein